MYHLLCSWVEAQSPICSMSTFVGQGLWRGDRLSCSAQTRILILATVSSAWVGKMRKEWRATQLKLLYVEAPMLWVGSHHIFLKRMQWLPFLLRDPPVTLEGQTQVRWGTMMWPGVGNGAPGCPLSEWHAVPGGPWAVGRPEELPQPPEKAQLPLSTPGLGIVATELSVWTPLRGIQSTKATDNV